MYRRVQVNVPTNSGSIISMVEVAVGVVEAGAAVVMVRPQIAVGKKHKDDAQLIRIHSIRPVRIRNGIVDFTMMKLLRKNWPKRQY